jgi:hypothetical protein
VRSLPCGQPISASTSLLSTPASATSASATSASHCLPLPPDPLSTPLCSSSGYSDHPTQLSLSAFYLFTTTLVLLHVLQWYRAKRAAESDAEEVKTTESDAKEYKTIASGALDV